MVLKLVAYCFRLAFRAVPVALVFIVSDGALGKTHGDDGLPETSSRRIKFEPITDSSSAATSPEKTSDPYWEYYETCDFWKAQFTVSANEPNRQPLDSSLIHQIRNATNRVGQMGKQISGRISPPMKNVAFSRPVRPSARLPVKAKLTHMAHSISSAFSTAEMKVAALFESSISPHVRQWEFDCVESATYPEFFLSDPHSDRTAIVGRSVNLLAEYFCGMCHSLVGEMKSRLSKVGLVYWSQRFSDQVIGK